MLERAAGGGGWFTIAAVADDLDAVASRLGLEVGSGSRMRPDGQTVRWRMAGLDDPGASPGCRSSSSGTSPTSCTPGALESGTAYATGLAWVEVGGDAERLRTWLGGDELPIRVTDDEPGIHRVAISTSDGELVIE